MLTLIEDEGDTCHYWCTCGTRFLASPCGEENVVFDEKLKCLVSRCPSCGTTEMTLTVAHVLPQLKSYLAKPGNETGGSFAVYVRHLGFEDSHIRWCTDYAERMGDTDGVKLGRLILKLTKTQRIKLAHYGFFIRVKWSL